MTPQVTLSDSGDTMERLHWRRKSAMSAVGQQVQRATPGSGRERPEPEGCRPSLIERGRERRRKNERERAQLNERDEAR